MGLLLGMRKSEPHPLIFQSTTNTIMAEMLNGSDSPVAALYAVRGAVGLSGSLSILGSCAIILSYAAFRELRTTARQILLNLSIADIILSLSLLLGLLQNADNITNPYGHLQLGHNGTIPYWLCQMQASIITFCNDTSIFWTISVAVYFFVVIVLQKPKKAARLLPFFYIFNWGIPIGIVVWLLTKGSLGYEAGTDPAFCSIISTLLINGTRVDADYPILLGYEIWNYVAFVVLPILFLVTISLDRRHKRLEKDESVQLIERDCECVSSNSTEGSSTNTSLSNSIESSKKKYIILSEMADGKVVIVPVVYILLKFIGLIVDIGIYFLPTHARTTYRMNAFSSVLIFASGVGTSIPGLVHGLIFCVLTKEVRQTMAAGIWSALTNCEICIYDKRWCCCLPSSSCCSRHSEYPEHLSDKTSVTPAQELKNPASPRLSTDLTDSVFPDYDVIPSPDPTSAVSIFQIPKMPRFEDHLETD